jgi:large subunit ribosomal protein L25
VQPDFESEQNMEATLKAVKRDTRGKNEARRLRRAGQIPATVYGGSASTDAIAVDPKALSRILHSEAGVNSLISLVVDEAPAVKVLVKEYQLEPVKHALLHADFYRVALDRPITVTVPVVITGEAKGVKQQGGVLDFVTREVEVECLPADIPENLEVDVTELLMGQSVRLKDVQGAKWTTKSDPETMLVHVVAARIVAEAPAVEVAAAPATAEPEIIKKGKAEKAEGGE